MNNEVNRTAAAMRAACDEYNTVSRLARDAAVCGDADGLALYAADLRVLRVRHSEARVAWLRAVRASLAAVAAAVVEEVAR